ncbi:MAG TPA: hypothetical protein VIC54_05020 [Terriglobales bacterium]|jgi:hypothetical protein
MRSMTCVLSLLTCLLLGAGAAAQSVINLQGGAGQTVTFTGMGAGTASLGVTLGSCGFGDGCVLYGLGAGSGNLASSGVFLINTAPGSIQAGGSDALALQSSAPIAFPYYGIDAATGQMGLLLDGALNLTNFNLAASNQSGTTADVGGYLTVSGGSLAAAAGSTLGLTLGVDLPSWTSLTSLVGTGNSLSAALAGGTLAEISPAPEPAGWMLAALGALILGGGYLRRRLQPGALA